jgi:hypothetical protein
MQQVWTIVAALILVNVIGFGFALLFRKISRIRSRRRG